MVKKVGGHEQDIVAKKGENQDQKRVHSKDELSDKPLKIELDDDKVPMPRESLNTKNFGSIDVTNLVKM